MIEPKSINISDEKPSIQEWTKLIDSYHNDKIDTAIFNIDDKDHREYDAIFLGGGAGAVLAHRICVPWADGRSSSNAGRFSVAPARTMLAFLIICSRTARRSLCFSGHLAVRFGFRQWRVRSPQSRMSSIYSAAVGAVYMP